MGKTEGGLRGVGAGTMAGVVGTAKVGAVGIRQRIWG
jgi:hypothetical protein